MWIGVILIWFLDKRVPEFPPGDSFHGSPPREHQDLFRRPLGTDNDGTFKHLLNVPEGTLKPESFSLGKQTNKRTVEQTNRWTDEQTNKPQGWIWNLMREGTFF